MTANDQTDGDQVTAHENENPMSGAIARTVSPRPAVPPGRARWWLAAAGLVLGAAAKAADTLGPALGDLTTYPAVWMLLVTAIAVTAPSSRRAALEVAITMLPVCLAYDAMAVAVYGYGLDRWAMIWIVASVTLAPAAAWFLATAWLHSASTAGLAIGAAAGTILAEGPPHQLLLRIAGHLPPDVPQHGTQLAAEIVSVVLLLRLAKHRGGVWLALLALLPSAMLADVALNALYAL
jgi:hypothetical protein